MQEANIDINKLVSLTFDEDPEVRKQAAKSLAAHGDPAALFALVELSYDKDPTVRETAVTLLEKAKKMEPEVMSFAKIFSQGSKKEEKKKDIPRESRERVLQPITQLFEKRLGKERADLVKQKMMPTIEKIYLKNRGQSKKKNEEGDRKVMQEFLTNYLEVISDLDQVGGSQPQPEPMAETLPQPEPAAEHLHEGDNGLSQELDEVGMQASGDQISSEISSEIANLEMDEIDELKEQEEMKKLPDTFFKKAYEVMMLSGGDDKIMRKEMKHMISHATREITLAFNLAKKKFKETKITNITKLKDKMRNINTDPLTVGSVENMEYQRTKTKAATVTRVVVNDEDGNEGVIYLFEDRGIDLKPGMRIQIQRGLAKTFKFSGETALTLGKKSNVYIVL